MKKTVRDLPATDKSKFQKEIEEYALLMKREREINISVVASRTGTTGQFLLYSVNFVYVLCAIISGKKLFNIHTHLYVYIYNYKYSICNVNI